LASVIIFLIWVILVPRTSHLQDFVGGLNSKRGTSEEEVEEYE
jgi:hypothetical protein